MANSYKASCACGFQRSVRTGGTRKTFETESYFPFFCERCGLISVNVAAPHSACPDCKSTGIKAYGNLEISIDNEWKMVQCLNYEAPKEGNLCPKCGEFSLNFELQMILG